MSTITRHGAGVPPILSTALDDLTEGNVTDERIVCGTGAAVLAADLDAAVAARFELARVAFVYCWSARDTGFQTRARRPMPAG